MREATVRDPSSWGQALDTLDWGNRPPAQRALTSSCISDLAAGSILAGGFTRTITCGASRKACSAGETNFFQLVTEYLVEKVIC